MRTLGFLVLSVVAAALYYSPGPLMELVLDAATQAPPQIPSRVQSQVLSRVPPQAPGRQADIIFAADSVTIKPWETVAQVIADANLVRVLEAGLSRDGATTLFTMKLSQGLTAEVFTLSDPYRVVIDMPEVAFALPDGTGQAGRGLVRTFRYGLFSEEQGRVVLDTTGPVRIDGARMMAQNDGMAFEIRLVAISNTEFGQGTGAGREAAKPKPTAKLEQRVTKPTSVSTKPVVVIDPGHGGIDPGAVGPSNLLEKNVVLGVGLALRDALIKSGKFEVRMTRARDVFLSLDRRVMLSRQHEADLFVSLHADSVSDTDAAAVLRGASVYTLSERASDEQARLMAEKENASDLLAGISSDKDNSALDVRSILIDLMQRETANFSTEFSNVLVRQLRRNVSLSRGPQRFAAFKVLKQTHAPSVLIELGYMSHVEDERLMRTKAWQRKVAGSISKAIQSYFRERKARR